MKQIIFLLVFATVYQFGFSQQKKIEYRSNTLYTTQELGTDIKILVDSVVFLHEDAVMYCDSALFNPFANVFDAFGRISVIKPTEQNDTVLLYGDTLRYNGNTKLASVRNRVSLINDSLFLFTDSLDYDLGKDIGHYFNGGITINGDDTISSDLGYYYAGRDEFFFKDNVVVNNPRFQMLSDTLMHNTKEHVSYFHGPTEIFSDENYIYCEDGWYNHDLHISRFGKNAFIQNEEQSIKGQLITYDRNKGIGQAYTDVEIRDTTQNVLLKGNYGYYNENTEYSLMTDSALFIQIGEQDSLFLHADTIRSFYMKPEQAEAKKIDEEEPERFRVIQAYYRTKIFKKDFQAKCDSLVYNFQDSIMELHGKPVIWADENQLSAELIHLLTRNNEVEQMILENNAFIIMQSDSVRFNQIKGNRMIGFIEERELVQIDVYENGESLYFLKDDDDLLIGSNHITCKDMNIYLEDEKIERIWFYENPKAVMKPPNSLKGSQRELPGFSWEEKQRPKNKYDIFVWFDDYAAETEESAADTSSSPDQTQDDKSEIPAGGISVPLD